MMCGAKQEEETDVKDGYPGSLANREVLVKRL
jgi:hypothetical protein